MNETEQDAFLDKNIIYFYKNDRNNMIQKLGINPKNLYSFEKKITTHTSKSSSKKLIKSYKNKSSLKKGGVTGVSRRSLNVRTKYKLTTDNDKYRIHNFINFFALKLRENHGDIVGIHIPIVINGTRYYIELTAKINKKIIIAINEDRRHLIELVHYSCFIGSFVHITFILNDNHYKMYNTLNPIPSDKWLGIYRVINDIKTYFFDNIQNIHASFYDNSVKNNWYADIFNHRDNPNIIRRFEYNLYLLKEAINYLSSTPRIIAL